MGLGRRKIRLEDSSAWVFNRMADVYDARPAYPPTLVDALTALVPAGGKVGDFGAGTGHLTLPLAAHGLDVVAIEPAQAMLDRLRARALADGHRVSALHATAESVPLPGGSLDLAIVADALHFLDAERAGLEIGRCLKADGVLAVVLSQLGDTPFMRSLVALMEEAAPRRPRAVSSALKQLSRVAKVTLTHEQSFVDDTPVDAQTLEQILRSISFIGPAMNEPRFAAFTARVRAIPEPPVWSRRFVLHWGTRRAP